jgi:flagellar basal-body rod protein FlgC
MSYVTAIEVSAAGMSAQKARLEAAALNLANMNTSSAPGAQGYRPVAAVLHATSMSFAGALGAREHARVIVRASLAPQAGSGVRTVYEPGHPHADARGMVAFPAIDHTREMLTVMSALRAYEANLAVLQVTKTLAAKALEIGSR